MTQEIDPQNEPCRIQILIVDDHAIVRAGLAQLIGQEPDMEVCGEAENANQAIDLLANLKADLVIMDISIGGMTGIQLTEKLKSLYPDLLIIVLSIHDDLTYVRRAFRTGAKGFVSKHEASEGIIAAIRDVISGKLHVSRAMAEKIIEAKTSRFI